MLLCRFDVTALLLACSRRFTIPTPVLRRSSPSPILLLLFRSHPHRRSLRGDDEKQSPEAAGGGTLLPQVEKLPREESVVSAFQSWMWEGLAIHQGDIFHAIHQGNIFHAINRLRKLEMNKRVLEVMEWVIRERPYKLRELDYSYLLEFTTKLHGVQPGASLFLRIPREYQNELLYNNLVMDCLDKGLIRLSLAYNRK